MNPSTILPASPLRPLVLPLLALCGITTGVVAWTVFRARAEFPVWFCPIFLAGTGVLLAVIARMPKDWDLRWLSSVDGKWLNDGNDAAPSLEGARARISRVRAFKQAERLRDSRPPVADPEKHLRPFVEFLQREASDPQEFILKALERHPVVVLGEVHNRQRYWAFNAALVRSPKFAQHAMICGPNPSEPDEHHRRLAPAADLRR